MPNNEEPTFYEYLGHAPHRLKWRDLFSKKHISRVAIRASELIKRPFSLYSDTPVDPKDLPEPQAGFAVANEHVDLAKKLESEADHRREVLEQKADKTLSILIFLAPLLLSIITFVSRQPNQVSTIVEVLFSLTGVFLLAGFIAAFRAVAIKNLQKLSVKTIFDSKKQVWLPLSNQKLVRGLIYCAAWNEAMNDHVAEFVSSARFYTVAGMFFLMAASAPILWSQAHVVEDSQTAALQSVGLSINSLTNMLNSLSTKPLQCQACNTCNEESAKQLVHKEHKAKMCPPTAKP